MVSGKEKAAALVSLLGPKANDVLKLLTDEQSALLMKKVDDGLPKDPAVVNELVKETLDKMGIDRSQVTAPVLPEDPQDILFSDVTVGDGEKTIETSELELPELDLEEPKEDAKEDAKKKDETEAKKEDSMKEDNIQVSDERAKKIAEFLSRESIQLVAFVLARLNEEIKTKIQHALPSSIVKKVNAKDVVFTPISDKVYQFLYRDLFLS